MKITKKNGTIMLYDDEKVIRSILRANGEVEWEVISEKEAAVIANEVFDRVTKLGGLISTADVRSGVYAVLLEKGYPETAQHYMQFKKQD